MTQERESGKRRQKENLRKLVLESVKFAGVLGVALVAPNVVGAMAKLGVYGAGLRKGSIHRSRDNLIRRGYLTRRDGSVFLTRKGEGLLRRLQLSEFKQRKPRRWDGKWRGLVFDIPNSRKGLRDKVRRTLKMIGFVQLQQSVWVYPYDCEEVIALLKADFRAGRDLQYLIIDSIEYDRDLRKTFGLDR